MRQKKKKAQTYCPSRTMILKSHEGVHRRRQDLRSALTWSKSLSGHEQAAERPAECKLRKGKAAGKT